MLFDVPSSGPVDEVLLVEILNAVVVFVVGTYAVVQCRETM